MTWKIDQWEARERAVRSRIRCIKDGYLSDDKEKKKELPALRVELTNAEMRLEKLRNEQSD